MFWIGHVDTQAHKLSPMYMVRHNHILDVFNAWIGVNVYMDVFGFVWMCMDVYGCVWMCK